MISPSDKLLLWVALLLPFAALAGLVPSSAFLCVALAGVLALAALADARRGRRSLQDLSVMPPPVVRLTRDQAGSIPLVIRNATGRARHLRVCLPLPATIGSDQDVLTVDLPEGHAASTAAWPCRPSQRGNCRLQACTLETRSPLGLWLVRTSTPCETEIRTYPDLSQERRQLASLFLNRGTFGIHVQRMVGQGREFEKLREYLPGDSFDDIHWKATAKRGRPVTKLYQMERTQEVYVLMDLSRLSGRRIGEEPVLEKFITAALVLGMVAERQGDRFGLIAFSDRVQNFIRAGGGRAHHTACRDTLYRLNPDSGSADFGELFTFVRLHLRRRALLLVLTDLGDPVLAEDFARTVAHVCRQHLVLVTMMREASTEPLFCKADAILSDTLYEKLGDHLIWENLRETGRRLQHRNVQFSLTTSERLSPEIVNQYMRVKTRQIL